MKKIIIWILLIAAITGAAVYFYLFNIGAKHDDPLDSKNKITLDATSLYNLFSDYEDSANTLYLDKTILVNGTIEGIDLKNNRYTVNFATGGMGVVACEMDTVENAKIKSLQSGTKAKVAGFCNGFLMDVQLDRCKLAE
jgi:hypothetical protein